MKLTANGIEIHYAVAGKGPVVTLSHSLGCDLSMWDDQVKVLSPHYRVLAFDTRGHGQSSAPPGAYSLGQMAEDLQALLTGLGIQETHFVGLSMGGMIGQVFALAYPRMVKRLVLCDTTSSYPGDVWPLWAERIKTLQEKG
ncbi:MAG TPA: alpha/beta fold hydrolase, partial [Candidatus Acidoferrum sp.]|nr:alpha/beta fold hydrolase [Candidatus Acidoferrum sp.]